MSRYYTGHVGIIDINAEIQAYLKEDIKKTELLVVVPSNFNDTGRIERHTGYLKTLLGNIGIVFDKTIALTEDMKKEEMQELIKKADVVFLNGGDSNIQLEIIKNNNLSESIRNTKAIVIGMSAGAMCMSKYSWMCRVMKNTLKWT